MSSARGRINRRPADDYQTPPALAEAFCALLDWDRIGSVMEPFRGAGAFYDAFPAGRRKHWCEIQLKYTRRYPAWPRNYFTGRPPAVDATITNPPFSHFVPAVRRARVYSRFVAILMTHNTWGSLSRYDFWKGGPQPSHQITAVPRPSFVESGETDSVEYCFVCWDGLGALADVEPFDVLKWDKPSRRGRTHK